MFVGHEGLGSETVQAGAGVWPNRGTQAWFLLRRKIKIRRKVQTAGTADRDGFAFRDGTCGIYVRVGSRTRREYANTRAWTMRRVTTSIRSVWTVYTVERSMIKGSVSGIISTSYLEGVVDFLFARAFSRSHH